MMIGDYLVLSRESIFDEVYGSSEVGKYPGILIGPQRWNTGTLARLRGVSRELREAEAR
jgi:hypothetical protein